MITVVLADDHAIFREGLATLLASKPDISVVGQARDGHEALALVGELEPDVVVLDVSMPGKDGIEVLSEARGLKTAFIMLTMHGDIQRVTMAVKNGAKGYLLKEGAFDELAAAIREVAGGREYITPAIREQLAQAGANLVFERLPEKDHKVLIVDDDSLILETTAVILGSCYSVVTVSSAGDAYALLLREKPDCILIDIVMPGESGIDFIKRIRGEGYDTPVIVMTGKGNLQYAEECANLHTRGYIKKPFSADELLAAVDKTLTKPGNESPSQPVSSIHPLLEKVRAWIGENLSSSFTLPQAAMANGTSVSHLSRLCREHLGMSFTDLVNRMRVERAKWLLRSTGDSVDAIRQVVGYESQQHFFSQFKKLTGKTPREYRHSRLAS